MEELLGKVKGEDVRYIERAESNAVTPQVHDLVEAFVATQTKMLSFALCTSRQEVGDRGVGKGLYSFLLGIRRVSGTCGVRLPKAASLGWLSAFSAAWQSSRIGQLPRSWQNEDVTYLQSQVLDLSQISTRCSRDRLVGRIGHRWRRLVDILRDAGGQLTHNISYAHSWFLLYRDTVLWAGLLPSE